MFGGIRAKILRTRNGLRLVSQVFPVMAGTFVAARFRAVMEASFPLIRTIL
ncbi:MAG TPA: hypothetical protein VFM52_08345 [Rhodanobacter sp.]|nr:hypothetical protein [Rhodanobacter sp.]